jgi:hypothetical protein
MDLNDETLPTSIKRKHPRKGEKGREFIHRKLMSGKDQSPGKQNSSKERWATRRKGNH